MDSASPLFGWELGQACSYGIRHETTAADIYGCLFFHIKDQFQKFATRAKDFNLNITMIPTGLVPNLTSVHFDRIETSNMADSIGVGQVIQDWAPLLETHTPHY
ncbi:hypothetical protein B0H10DRAFT_1945270 [Mycena sp. CBHHK59/15]|nr:hypothetical protein B0H10DRAFT_1945270 [Mycena sp. CBHHK59/15]